MSEIIKTNNSLINETDSENQLSVTKVNEKKLIKNKVQKTDSKIKLFDYISLVKIISVYSVVILHTNYAFWNFQPLFYSNYWISANIIESVFYFAVPMFILCVGATLLDFTEKYGLIKYYYRRFIKVVLPLMSWNIILYFYRVYILKNFPKENLNFEKIWNLYFFNRIYFIFESFRHFLLVYVYTFISICR